VAVLGHVGRASAVIVNETGKHVAARGIQVLRYSVGRAGETCHADRMMRHASSENSIDQNADDTAAGLWRVDPRPRLHAGWLVLRLSIRKPAQDTQGKKWNDKVVTSG